MCDIHNKDPQYATTLVDSTSITANNIHSLVQTTLPSCAHRIGPCVGQGKQRLSVVPVSNHVHGEPAIWLRPCLPGGHQVALRKGGPAQQAPRSCPAVASGCVGCGHRVSGRRWVASGGWQEVGGRSGRKKKRWTKPMVDDRQGERIGHFGTPIVAVKCMSNAPGMDGWSSISSSRSTRAPKRWRSSSLGCRRRTMTQVRSLLGVPWQLVVYYCLLNHEICGCRELPVAPRLVHQ